MFETMKHYSDLKDKFLFFIHVVIVSLLCFCFLIVPHAICAELKDEPRISLNAKNQPLESVLNQITQETGVEFNLSDQWRTYPVTANLDGIPLHQGLKHILRKLNHTILYDSEDTITIGIYGKIESRRTGSNLTPYLPQPNPVPPEEPEPAPEVANEPENAPDHSEGNDSSKNSELDDIKKEIRPLLSHEKKAPLKRTDDTAPEETNPGKHENE